MKKYSVDLLIIAFILAVSLVMFWSFGGENSSGEAAEVKITVDGSLYGTYPVNVDNVINIDTKYGHNLIVIKDGGVWMEESDCDNLSCVNMGKIAHSYESIVCIPHRVVIELTGENKENLDAIVY